jgi:carboxymethylenebutenolidase
MPAESVRIMSEVDGRTGDLEGVLGRPVGEGPWPGVVLVHELFGVDAVMRRQVERVAQAGYLALMPDLFGAGGTVRCLISTFRALQRQQGRAWADIEAARLDLIARDDCTGRIGVLGFCLGGGFALVAASRGFDVSAPNYAPLPKDLYASVVEACPVVASYGAADRGLRGAAAKLEEVLSRAGVEHDVREYPGAGHQFLNDAPNGPGWLRPIMRISGAGPDPESAADAWNRIESFFERHLKTP